MEDLGSSSFGGIAMISQPMGGKDEGIRCKTDFAL